MSEETARPWRTWSDLWLALSTEERAIALEQLHAEHRNNSDWLRHLQSQLARQLKMRPQTVQRWPSARFQQQLTQQIVHVFSDQDWQLLFRSFYCTQRVPLMVAFLDGIQLGHDGQGRVLDEQNPTEDATERTQATLAPLLERFGLDTVRHYFSTLCLMGRIWTFLLPIRDLLEQQAHAAYPSPVISTAAGTPSPPSITLQRSFSTLDQILEQQIIATASHGEAALSSVQLGDLIDDVIALNPQRVRSYFHLGFMEALLEQPNSLAQRPESDELRREWYLSGRLCAYRRQGHSEALRHTLKTQARDFHRAIHGPAGELLAAELLAELVDLGHSNEALNLLKAQLKQLSGVALERLAQQGLQLAQLLLQGGEYHQALAWYELLNKVDLPALELDPRIFQHALTRLHGQCLQRQNLLDAARDRYARLLQDKTLAAHERANVLTDFALSKCKLRSLSYLRLIEGGLEEAKLRKALKQHQDNFREAAELGDTAAHYVLAMLGFLDYRAEQQPSREQVLAQLDRALLAVRSSVQAQRYSEWGLTGQLLLMQTLLRLEALDSLEAQAARCAWQDISPDAGRFRQHDLQQVLFLADTQDPALAAWFAESIWQHHQTHAVTIFRSAQSMSWLQHSPSLQVALQQLAHAAEQARELRFWLWQQLLVCYLAQAKLDEARAGLDALQLLAYGSRDYAQDLLAWLDDERHYHPAWDDNEAHWARLHLQRSLGQDQQCAVLLDQLFFLVRDQRGSNEARQVLDVWREWRLDEQRYHALEAALPLPERSAPEESSLDERLRKGEVVRIMFVGGNEIQRQYDAAVYRELKSEWPKVEIEFAHTGWSSNWGREMDALIKAANQSDVVVLMTMMRTLLGRQLRAALQKPWTLCACTGKGGILNSLRYAARLAVQQRGG